MNALKRLIITHRTTYRYAERVSFGPHRMMLRPRDSHEMRLISATLTTSLPADYAWTYDVFGNEVCTGHFSGQASELEIESRLEIDRFPSAVPTHFLSGRETPFPIVYSADEAIDLGATMLTSAETYPDDLRVWIAGLPRRYSGGAMDLLTGLCQEIHGTFTYETRFEQSTQDPALTFRNRSGACRDFAALFIACARLLGFGARFVSGYLFDPIPENGEPAMQGAGASHAWADVYLPDTGWVEFDPTNGLVASDRLIRIAVVREPHQALPISGSFVGTPSAFVGLWVGVDVEQVLEGRELEVAPA
ncbi:transglutaminase family protein [Labrys miyagiensis]|uniref:transglutaminase family protein n=1 Tax=Labrys miyagiensis TaxID=346912 RepID=UPI0024E0A91F|nr:transglutaminase family protein [Labrys miyagiensis]